MAKLYWRVKRDGKWTWQPAIVTLIDTEMKYCEVQMEDEEK